MAVAPVAVYGLNRKVRRHPPAAVNNRRSRHRQLDRRDLKRLPEGDRSQLHRSDILHLVHDGAGFPGQIDPCPVQQAELPEIGIVTFRPHPHSHRDKHRVAGIHRALHEILRPVASCFMAAYPAVFHHDEPRTVESVRRLDHSRFQPGRRRNDLKGRSRLVSIVDAPVSPDTV